MLACQSLSRDEQDKLGRLLFNRGQFLRAIDRNLKVAAIPKFVPDEDKVDDMLTLIKSGLRFVRRTGHDWNTKKSFLGTIDQWKKFIAYEANGENAYRAAAEFLHQNAPRLSHQKGKRGAQSRSEVQRDCAGSITRAVKAIRSWFPQLYPGNDSMTYCNKENRHELSSVAAQAKCPKAGSPIA